MHGPQVRLGQKCSEGRQVHPADIIDLFTAKKLATICGIVEAPGSRNKETNWPTNARIL